MLRDSGGGWQVRNSLCANSTVLASCVTCAWLAVAGRVTAQPTPLDPLEFQVQTCATCSEEVSELALDLSGSIVVVWTSWGSPGGDDSGRSVQGRRFRENGLPLDAEQFQVNSYTTSHQSSPAVAASPSGDFVVVWEGLSDGSDQEGTSIQGRRFGAGRQPLDAVDLQINEYTPNGQIRPAVAVDEEGNFVVVWESAGSFGTDDSGTSIQARRFRADGAPRDPVEFQVNTFEYAFQHSPSVAMSPRGEFIVAWHSQYSDGNDVDGSCIRARRFANDGAPLDASDFEVNSYTTGDQRWPGVGVDAGGDFVITWMSDGSAGNDQTGTSIQARRFSADGTARDQADFQVNAFTAGEEYAPRVATNTEGDFVVAWNSFGSAGGDLSESSVQARRFRSDGSAVDSGELQLNTYTTLWQSEVALAVRPDGDFVAAWASCGNSTCVHARRFGRPTLEVTTTSGGTGGPECKLIDAISAANTGIATGGCAAGSGGAVITLPAGSTIALSAEGFGQSALPTIQRPVTIRGRGARVARDLGLACPLEPEFRLFRVTGSAVLGLEDVSVVNGCVSEAPGGGALVEGGTLLLRNAVIEGNETGTEGAGVSVVDGSLVSLDSTLRGNLASGPGGGVSIVGNSGLLYLSGSTISENGSSTGAGFHFAAAGPMVVRNSTISGNSASLSGGGLEIAAAGSQVSLDFATLVGNQAPVGAGVYAWAGGLEIHGSLVGENLDGADCTAGTGTIDASGVNLDTDGSCAALAGNGVVTVSSLGVGLLADNGGATRTHLPLAASPALDAAPVCETRSGSAVTTDQRGLPRPTDDDGDLIPECELGAVERGPIFVDGFDSGGAARWSGSVM